MMADQQVEEAPAPVPVPIPIPEPDIANPLFAGAPRYHWQQHFDGEKMAESKDRMIQWIKRKVAERARADNNGIQQVVTQEVNGTKYSFDLTAESGFFKIVITPAPDYSDEDLPLVLAFSFRDLYLLGFFHGNIWYLFDDAKLDGSGHLDHPGAFDWLGFKGSYDSNYFSTVELSNWYLFQSYDSLVHYPGRTRDDILVALFRYIVSISEPCRFPQWHTYLQCVLKNDNSETINTDFVFWFQNWSTISKRARRGAARFVVNPGEFFPTFESLLKTIDGGVALSRPPANQL